MDRVLVFITFGAVTREADPDRWERGGCIALQCKSCLRHMSALKVMVLDSWRKLKHEEVFVRTCPFP